MIDSVVMVCSVARAPAEDVKTSPGHAQSVAGRSVLVYGRTTQNGLAPAAVSRQSSRFATTCALGWDAMEQAISRHRWVGDPPAARRSRLEALPGRGCLIGA